ncbi:MAG: GtrA family protein [Anaerolineae bacterium]|nr:GtrA family protein [Anaerolineae bacterium]
MMLLNNSRERTRFIRFAIVGTLGAIIDTSIYNILIGVFGVALRMASTVAFTAAVSSNFIWNRYWTYPDSRSKPLANQLVQFFVVNIAGLLIRNQIITTLAPPLDVYLRSLPYDLPEVVLTLGPPDIALGVAIVVILFWNFFVNRYWTYGDVG